LHRNQAFFARLQCSDRSPKSSCTMSYDFFNNRDKVIING
jgi:hypothetical protein